MVQIGQTRLNKILGGATGCPERWCNIYSWRFSRLSWTKLWFTRYCAGNGFDSRPPKAPSNQLFYDSMKRLLPSSLAQPSCQMSQLPKVQQVGLNKAMFFRLHKLTKLVLDGTRSGNILNKHICGKI